MPARLHHDNPFTLSLSKRSAVQSFDQLSPNGMGS